MKPSTKEIPIFFASDDNYAPFLAVALKSIVCNASKKYDYRIFVLTTGLTQENQRNLLSLIRNNFSLEFVDVTSKMDRLGGKIHLRDYYTQATYFRLFIPEMFPEFHKALYLDCDIVVRGDISRLYNFEIANNLLGAVQEEVMAEVGVFGSYVEKTLGIKRQEYFSAGILLLNLDQFRIQHIEEKFVDLLQKFKFGVTQDQDYLNVICKGQVTLLPLGWNKSAFKEENVKRSQLHIIHYKLNWKPWHYDGIAYENYFWKYLNRTPYVDKVYNIKSSYGSEQQKSDEQAYINLVNMALNDTYDENNYYNTICRFGASV